MKTVLYNILIFFILFLIFILVLGFFNIKYSGNPIYDRFGIETKHLKYFKKKIFNNIEREYLSYFSKFDNEQYLEFYKKKNRTNDLYSTDGEDINLVYFLDKNNCRENSPDDYFDTDIVLLGDSYLWGVSISSPFDISGKLRSYFPDKKILNLGTPGSGPVDQFIRLKNITKNNTFKNFIWFFYEGNDYQESTITEGSHLENKCGYIGERFNSKFKLKNISQDRYSFYIRLKIFISEFLRGLNSFIKTYKNYDEKYNLNEKDFDTTLNIAKKYLDSKNVDKRIIFYIPSYSYQSHKKNSNHPQIKKIIKLKNKVKEISLKNNFEFLDANLYMDNVKERLHLYHYGYPTHFNSLGYKMIAEQIYEYINEN